MKEFEFIDKLLHWASGGALSASLAFIVFVPTLSNVDPEFQDYSMMCFIAAIPFLSLSLSRYKEYELKNTTRKDQSASHISTAVAGFLMMVVGFSMLLAAIKLKYFFGLAGAFEQKLTVSPSRSHLKP